MVEVWIEDLCYALTLWWEVRPVLKVGPAGLRGGKNAEAVEVGGEARARANKRVMEMGGVTRIEALQQLVDGTRGQSCGSGQPVDPRLGGLNERGPAKPFGALGWILGLLDLIQLFSRLGRRVMG